MKIVTLSDYTSTQLQASAARREAGNALAVQSYQARVAQRKSEQIEAGRALREGWQARRFLATAAAFLLWLYCSLRPKPAGPDLQTTSRDEAVWASGREGEQAVASRLAKGLGDDWILITGYRNRRGEIDGVLVGPGGVFAIEIKFINGTVFCDGDRWWRDKYDRYGNLVEEAVPIADKSGRGPSLQVNESADALQEFLSGHVGVDRVRRAVIFAHEASEIGELRRPTVDCVATLATRDFTYFYESEGQILTGEQVRRVVAAVQKDHQFHDRPRRSGGTQPRQGEAVALRQSVRPTPQATVSAHRRAIRDTYLDGRSEPEVKL